MTIRTRTLLAAVALVAATASFAADPGSPFRGDNPINAENAAPPRMAPYKNDLVREPRNYPEQPPLIPHSVDGYVVDTNSNKCLSCHARIRTAESKAPMVSVTHFMDRDGQFLATVSPRRYFCTQCHVPQADVKAAIGNSFVDVDSVVNSAAGGVKP